MKAKTRLLFGLSCTFLALGAACGETGGEGGAYLLSWQFKYGNYLNDAEELKERDCTNENPGWPSSPIDKVVVNIADPEDRAAPYNAAYSCKEGFGGQSIALYGFTKSSWVVTIEAQRADGRPLYRYDKHLVDFATPLAGPLDLHAVTGNLSFSLAFGAADQLDPPAGVTAVELAFYRQNDEGGFQTDPTYFKRYTPAEAAYGLTVTELPAASHKPPAVVRYRLLAKALDQNNNVLYCGDEERPLKPGSDNLRNNLLLKAGACP